MNCIYHAHCEHLRWLGIRPTQADYLVYLTLKAYTHGTKPQSTFGGVVPWILQKLAGLHRLTVVGEYRIYTPHHHLKVATNPRQRRIISNHQSAFGKHVTAITLAPAIYLLLASGHAEFALAVPAVGCVAGAYKYIGKH